LTYAVFEIDVLFMLIFARSHVWEYYGFLPKNCRQLFCNGKDLRPTDFFVFRHRESFGESQRAAAVCGERGAARRPAPDRRRPMTRSRTKNTGKLANLAPRKPPAKQTAINRRPLGTATTSFLPSQRTIPNKKRVHCV